TIHAWAQADRYALALNFQKNGFDLFHPETFTLNKQFPAKDKTRTETGITQVDCPLHEYVIAMIMTALHNNSPVVFRLYNLLYGILGMFFLFLMVRNRTQSELKSLAVVLFAFLSPMLVFYFDGFLPSVSSLASVLIAYYFYFSYRNNRLLRNLLFAVWFATIAALSRTPFALILGAIFCQVLFDIFKNRKIEGKFLAPFFVAFAVLLAYFIYNRWMAWAYGSVFLTHIMPVTDGGEIHEILKHIKEAWLTSYFTIYHYAVFLILAIVFFVQWIRKKKLSDFQKQVGFQFVITASGGIAYFFLMVLQYYSHDYYFIDSFYIPCLLFVIMCMDSLRLEKLYSKAIFIVVLAIFGIMSYGKCKEDITLRYAEDPNSRVSAEVNSFEGSEKYLDSLKIDANAKILVLKAYSANIPQIMMNRSGYGLMDNSADDIKKSLTWDFNYIAVQNADILSEIVNSYPDIINQLEPLGTNGKISIYKKQFRKKELREFLQIKDSELFSTTSCPKQNDSISDMLSTNISCDSVFHIKSDKEFLDLLKLDISNYKSENLILIFTADCRMNLFKKGNTDLVLSVKRGEEQAFYKSYALNDYQGNENSSDFRKLSFLFPLKYNDKGKINMSFYLWNNGQNEMELKNIGIWIFGKLK
ncbi:MAG: glycosyltransferase family 39 protein, partial [Bacteroidota bacterium]